MSALLTLEMLRSMRDKLDSYQAVRIESPVVLMHPATHNDICRADARAQWYAQHRANRIAKRDGKQPHEVARQFTAETVEFLGVRIVVDGRLA